MSDHKNLLNHLEHILGIYNEKRLGIWYEISGVKPSVILTSPRSRSRNTVRGGSREVDVDGETRIASGQVARDGNLARASTSTTGHPNLGAGNVELRRAGDVQTDMLDTEQILQFPKSAMGSGLGIPSWYVPRRKAYSEE